MNLKKILKKDNKKEVKKETKEVKEIEKNNETRDLLEELEEIHEGKEVKPVEKDNKPVEVEEKEMKKRPRKKFKIDLSIVIFVGIIILVAGLVLYLTIGQRGSKYGDRLKGIDKISFTKKDKANYIDGIKSNDKVDSASIDIQGRIIYVIVDVKKDVSLEDAQNVLNESLNNLSDEVKGYYDINALITKDDEEFTETSEQDKDGNEVKKTHRVFPKSGYKKKTSDHIVW